MQTGGRMSKNSFTDIFGTAKEYRDMVRLMSEAGQSMSVKDPLRYLKIAQIDFLFKGEVELFEFYGLKEYGKLKTGNGIYMCLRNKELCPHKNHVHHFPALRVRDTFLEFSTGYMNFDISDLTKADLAEKEKLLEIKLLLGDLLSTKQESEIKSPIPFQCHERHKLWRMPDGSIIARNEPSIVDKTIDYAVDVIGMPNSLRWRGDQKP